MANVSGKSGGSYATVNRSANYLGGAMQNAQDNAFRFRQERKQIKDDAKAEKEAEAKSYGSPEFKAIATNNSSLNDLTSKQAIESQQSYLKFKDKALNAKTPNEKAEAIQGMQKVKNSFDYTQQFPTILNARRAEILKGKSEGLYDEASANEMLNSADQMNKGQANLRYDEAGNIRFDVYDKDGKIINENQTIESYLSSLNPLKKSTYNDDLLKYQSKYKVDETTTRDKNGLEITDQRVDRTVGSKDYNNAREYAQGIISKQNEREILAREHNIDPNDTEALIDFVTNDALNSLQSKYSKKEDPNLALNRVKEANDEAQRKKDNAFREKQLALQKAKETRIAKAEGKKINKRANGTLKPTFDDVYTTGVEVIRNETFDGEGNTIPKEVKVGARVISIDGMETYGANKLVKSKLTKTFINPDGSIVMLGNVYDETGKIEKENVVWDKNEDQLEFINSVTKDYDNNGNPINFETINNFKKHLIDKTGIKINTEPKSGVGSKYNN